MADTNEEERRGTAKTGVLLDEEWGRYEFWLAGVRVAHVSREQYEPLTQEQRMELCGIVWDEVFKGLEFRPEASVSAFDKEVM